MHLSSYSRALSTHQSFYLPLTALDAFEEEAAFREENNPAPVTVPEHLGQVFLEVPELLLARRLALCDEVIAVVVADDAKRRPSEHDVHQPYCL
jgi:hypothetical protein